jgi:hypothetical protein
LRTAVRLAHCDYDEYQTRADDLASAGACHYSFILTRQLLGRENAQEAQNKKQAGWKAEDGQEHQLGERIPSAFPSNPPFFLRLFAAIPNAVFGFMIDSFDWMKYLF